MRDGSNTRKKLERCALALFVKKGITATTIKDIAQKAQIAEGTLYRHYQSKDELALNLFTKAYEEIVAKLKEIAVQYSLFDQKMKVMIHFISEKYDEDPILFNYLLLTQHTQLKLIQEKENNLHYFIVDLLEEGMKKHEIKEGDPAFLSAIVLGVVLQAAISRVYGRITRSMISDADNLVSVVLKVVK